MIEEKSSDEKLMKDFLDSCKQFHEFYSSLTMPLYNDAPHFYEFFAQVNQQLRKLEFIILKLLPLLKEGKKLHDLSFEDESVMHEFQDYFSKNQEELSFFHEDFFIHSRILMDKLALLSSFLFKIKKKGKDELVDSFSSYFEHEKNGKRRIALKKDISEKVSEEYKRLMYNTVWYWKYLKNPRDQLLVHTKDAKHRLIGGVGFVSGGNSDILDGLTFSQAYPSKIKDDNFNDVLILKHLIPELTSFSSEYLKIIKKEIKKQIQTN